MNPCPKTKPVRLYGKAYTKFREEVYNHFKGICQECGGFAPLNNESDEFDIWICGHVAHIKSHGAGGGDTIDNVKWKHPKCHLIKEHGPQWLKKKEPI